LTQKINKLEKYKIENEKMEKIFQNLEEAILTISNNKIEFKNHLASDIIDKHLFELDEKFLKIFSNSQEKDDNQSQSSEQLLSLQDLMKLEREKLGGMIFEQKDSATE
jgi:hypothetical protein